MTPNDLATSIANLESSLDSAGFALVIATGIVAIGLVLEYWRDVSQILTTRPFRASSLKKIIGAVMVTVGVCGEFGIDLFAGRTETRLRAANTEAFATLNRDAAVARRDSSNANARAAASEGRIATLTVSSRELELQVADARARARASDAKVAAANAAAREAVARIIDAEARIAAANARAEDAKTTAESERTERVRLAVLAAPRQLRDSEMPAMLESLKPFSGKTVLVLAYSFDVEGSLLGNQISSLLNAADIRVSTNAFGLALAEKPLFGIRVSGPPSEAELVTSLRSMLSKNTRLGVVQTPLPDGKFEVAGVSAVIVIGARVYPPPPPSGMRIVP